MEIKKLIKLPKNFEEFSDARKTGFIEIKKIKESGTKVVGVYCAFTPQEIISAAGMVPVSLCGVSEEVIKDAERELPRNLCPLIKSSYGHAITDTCPYFYFADFIIGETTCDGKKKMYELIGKIKPFHMINLPKTQFQENSLDMMKTEVIRLKTKLEEHFNIEITERSIREQIVLYNKERRALKAFYELGKLVPPPLSGREIQSILDGSDFIFDSEGYIATLEQMTADALKAFESGEHKIEKTAPRIMITGCPIGGITEKVLGAIENAGAVVVAFENCGAIRTTEQLVEEAGDPYEALAYKYLNTGCSCMTPNTNRMELIERIVQDYQIDGVVDVVLQACHTFNVETATVSHLVKNQLGKPYMTIETDYSKSDLGQIQTRLEAFVELLS